MICLVIKTFLLKTSEPDDLDAALGEIDEQLEGITLLKNSVGLLCCHFDFVNSGIVRELMRRLPFPLVGITSFYQSTKQVSGLFELTITILTSDDVSFALSCDSGNEASNRERIKSAYNKALGDGPTPAVIFSFLSFHRPVTGDEYLRLLDEVSGGVCSFGGVSAGDDESNENMYVFCDGEVFTRGFAMLLLFGELELNYYFGSYLDQRLLAKSAIITKSEGCVVRSLDHKSAAGFLRSVGVTLDEEEKNQVSTIPYLIRRPGDSTLIARTMAGFGDTGELNFLAEMPEGSLLRTGTVTTEDILSVSHAVTELAMRENEDAVLLLIFSCLGRFITLGLDSTAEMDHIRGAIPESTSFLACYAAGEICPVKENGSYVNRYHNSSYVICTLK